VPTIVVVTRDGDDHAINAVASVLSASSELVSVRWSSVFEDDV
jgi:hypothetical protein